MQINRAYIRLDRQPEATRRAYAKEFGIALHELGLETEAVAVVAVEKAKVGRSDETDTGDCREDRVE